MKKIAIIGAFDRYNYGDLLFPIIIEKYLNKYLSKYLINYDIEFYSITQNDLSEYGGVKTKSIRELLNNEDILEDSIIILSGGEILGAGLSSMFLDLDRKKYIFYIYICIRKLIGADKFEDLIKYKLKIKKSFPWIINKNDFKNNVNIIYNTVGGSSINKMRRDKYDYIINQLINVDYISVRDTMTKSNLNGLNVKLYPDSATIISEFFSLNDIKLKVRENIQQICEKNINGYICIQTSLSSIHDKEQILCNQIEMIYKKYNCMIILVPIGIAANHDDDIALNKIHKLLKVPNVLCNDINIYEIMYLIGKCKLFAGTSLHGNITAMTYNVPHIGLNKDIKKMEEYLKTWDIDEQNKCVNFEELYTQFEKNIKIPKQDLIDNRNKLIELTYENFQLMFEQSLKETYKK